MKSFRHFLILLIIVILAATWLCNEPKDNEGSAKNAQQESVKEENKKQENKKQATPAKPVDRLAEWKNLDELMVSCQQKKINIITAIREITNTLSAQQIPYDASRLADCSGIFHQVLRKLQAICPEQVYPSVTADRDTRALARWYHEQGALTIISDPQSQSDLIKPGAVLFYGYGGKNDEQFTVQDLFQRGTGINHMGIVTEVEKNAQGQVTNYKLFHGRNPQYPAGITLHHRLKPSRSDYPPLGNGKQAWVAFAPIISK